ncbi:hypothetical protein Naga_100007g73 [Nannochloropsis gaditana]|uniref:Uncharacterized protein n=1 Tax=Nannochloropsis gaditana TaxID=72520 RepID=W7U8E2_9STRA|nr:hypothetical protein Naga_100007g73 [Nannochloropsis gaditana]
MVLHRIPVPWHKLCLKSVDTKLLDWDGPLRKFEKIDCEIPSVLFFHFHVENSYISADVRDWNAANRTRSKNVSSAYCLDVVRDYQII